MSDKKWHNTNEFKVGIALLIIGGISTVVYTGFGNKRIYGALKISAKWLWDKLISFLTFPVPVHWILISVLIVGAMYFVLRHFGVKKEQPDFFKYKTDKLRMWRWSWEYSGDLKKWEIIQLTPHCPHDDHEMTYFQTAYGIHVKCPKCGWEASERKLESKSEAKLMIESKIKRKSYTGAQQ